MLGEQYKSFSSSLCNLHSPVTSSLLGTNILLNDQASHPYKTTGKIIVLYILIFQFLDSNLQDKTFCTEWQQAPPDLNLLLFSSAIESRKQNKTKHKHKIYVYFKWEDKVSILVIYCSLEWREVTQQHCAHILQDSTPQPLPTASSRTRTTHQMQ